MRGRNPDLVTPEELFAAFFGAAAVAAMDDDIHQCAHQPHHQLRHSGDPFLNMLVGGVGAADALLLAVQDAKSAHFGRK